VIRTFTRGENEMSKSSRKRRDTRRDKSPREVKQTKKQIAFSRKEARQRRIIWLSIIALAVIILTVLAIGGLQELVFKPGQPVALVNGGKVRLDDYQALLTYRRYNLRTDIANLQDSLQSLDPSDETNEFIISFYQQQLTQLQSSLNTLSDSVLDELIDAELIRQKAEELGVTVTADEVESTIDEDIRQAFTLPAQQTITDTEQVLTPTPIPQDQVDELYRSALDGMGLSNKEFRTIVQRGLLYTKLQDHLADEVPTTGLVAHVQLIQTDTAKEAQEVLYRVESGEDWAVVATEVSTDTQTMETGGDWGWVTPGQLTTRYGEELDNYVFSLPVGEVGQVQSNEQFFVVQVLERDENGPLPDEVLTARQSTALQDWLEERKNSPDVEIERTLTPDQIPPDPFA
jgi:parvulin-like peptidyl-prolyl isomerase